MTNNNKQKGFSLLELLIVVGIIIVLATVSILALNGQRANARDAKRISDIRQIRTALEIYFSDEGEYPVVPDSIVLGVAGKEKLCSKALGGFVPSSTQCDAKVTYMAAVFSDPLPSGKYIYTGMATGYDITFTTEKASDLGAAGVYHAHTGNIDAVAGNR